MVTLLDDILLALMVADERGDDSMEKGCLSAWCTSISSIIVNIFENHVCCRCGVFKAQGTEHCWTIDACVEEFDHWCPLLSQPIGRGNYRRFLATLLFQLTTLVAAFFALKHILLSLTPDSFTSFSVIVLLVLCVLTVLFGLFTMVLLVRHTCKCCRYYCSPETRFRKEQGCVLPSCLRWLCRDSTPSKSALNVKLRDSFACNSDYWTHLASNEKVVEILSDIFSIRMRCYVQPGESSCTTEYQQALIDLCHMRVDPHCMNICHFVAFLCGEHVCRFILTEVAAVCDREQLHQLLEGKDANGRTPLILASAAGNCDVVRILFRAGVDLQQQKDCLGYTALAVSVQEKRHCVFFLLLGMTHPRGSRGRANFHAELDHCRLYKILYSIYCTVLCLLGQSHRRRLSSHVHLLI